MSDNLRCPCCGRSFEDADARYSYAIDWPRLAKAFTFVVVCAALEFLMLMIWGASL